MLALLIVPRIVPPDFRGRFVALSALLAIGTMLLTVTTSGTVQFAGLIFYGISASAFLPILTLILMGTPGVEPGLMGAAAGLFFCIGEMGGFTGPLAVGVLVDMTGSFLAGAIFLSLLSVTTFILTFFLTMPPASALKHRE